MHPLERRESGEQDLFRSRLDQVIDMGHALVKMVARTIDWRFLDDKCGAIYKDGLGQPPLPTRLTAGLAILKYTYNVSEDGRDETRSGRLCGASDAFNVSALKEPAS